jgi:YqaJ-like viral recombinase domain
VGLTKQIYLWRVEMSDQLVHLESAAPPPVLSEREQWLKGRLAYIGGSDCAAMFNEGYGCARRLVYEKRGTPPDYPRTPAELETLQRGTDLEEMVAFKFQQETDFNIRRMSTRLSKIEPRAGVNVDRQIIGVSEERLSELFPILVADDPRTFNVPLGPTGVLECKTANEFVFKQILQDGVPPHYVMQMQHSLAVTGYKWGIFAVLGYGPALWRVIWFPMLRDEALCERILQAVGETWNIIEGDNLPAALPQPDKRCRNCQWRRSCLGSALVMAVPDEDKDIPQDDSLAELATDYATARTAAEEANGLVEMLAEKIKERIGDKIGAIVPAAGVGFGYKTGKGAMRWDGKAIDAVVGLTEKSIKAVDPNEKANPWFVALEKFAAAIRGCRRASAPSRPFRFFEL